MLQTPDMGLWPAGSNLYKLFSILLTSVISGDFRRKSLIKEKELRNALQTFNDKCQERY